MTEAAELSQAKSRTIARLRDRKGRRREGAVLVEGVRAVEEALRAGVEVRFALRSPRLQSVDGEGRVASMLPPDRTQEVSDTTLGTVSDTGSSQGVLLVCAEPEGAEGIREAGRFLVADAVQDPGNLGTLVRAAVAFGLDGVVVLDGTVDPWSPKTVRASAGMIFRIPVVRMDAARAASELTSVGVPLLVADAAGADVRRSALPRSFALVVGNEGAGVREELDRAAGLRLAVSMPGGAESLNVGMAGAILLHELTRAEMDEGEAKP